MKVNVLPWFFKPTDDFAQVIRNRTYREVMFDSDITKYIESNSVMFHGRKVCIGRESSEHRIGFAGCCEVLEVDERRNWVIRYNNLEEPYIQYVFVKIENGLVSIYDE